MTLKDRQRAMWDAQDAKAKRVDWMRVAELEHGLYGDVLSPEAQRVWKARQDTAKRWRAWEQGQVAVTGGGPRMALGGVYGLPEPPRAPATYELVLPRNYFLDRPRAPVILPYEPLTGWRKSSQCPWWCNFIVCASCRRAHKSDSARGNGAAPAYGKPLTPEQARDAVAVAYERRIAGNSPPDNWRDGPPWERAIWDSFYHSDQATANLLDATAKLRATMDHMTAADRMIAQRNRHLWMTIVTAMLAIVVVIVFMAASVV